MNVTVVWDVGFVLCIWDLHTAFWAGGQRDGVGGLLPCEEETWVTDIVWRC
jgi:hypothetical protein